MTLVLYVKEVKPLACKPNKGNTATLQRHLFAHNSREILRGNNPLLIFFLLMLDENTSRLFIGLSKEKYGLLTNHQRDGN